MICETLIGPLRIAVGVWFLPQSSQCPNPSGPWLLPRRESLFEEPICVTARLRKPQRELPHLPSVKTFLYLYPAKAMERL